jgi:hypothetical protein
MKTVPSTTSLYKDLLIGQLVTQVSPPTSPIMPAVLWACQAEHMQCYLLKPISEDTHKLLQHFNPSSIQFTLLFALSSVR